MIPVYQTMFGPFGNCQSACIASLLELPLSAVPNFNHPDDPDSFNYHVRQYAWLETRGLSILTFDTSEIDLSQSKGWFIAGGKSPRGNFLHAVIWHNGKMVHDPHPDGRGIESVTEADLLYPIDPWLHRLVTAHPRQQEIEA